MLKKELRVIVRAKNIDETETHHVQTISWRETRDDMLDAILRTLYEKDNSELVVEFIDGSVKVLNPYMMLGYLDSVYNELG